MELWEWVWEVTIEVLGMGGNMLISNRLESDKNVYTRGLSDIENRFRKASGRMVGEGHKEFMVVIASCTACAFSASWHHHFYLSQFFRSSFLRASESAEFFFNMNSTLSNLDMVLNIYSDYFDLVSLWIWQINMDFSPSVFFSRFSFLSFRPHFSLFFHLCRPFFHTTFVSFRRQFRSAVKRVRSVHASWKWQVISPFSWKSYVLSTVSQRVAIAFTGVISRRIILSLRSSDTVGVDLLMGILWTDTLFPIHPVCIIVHRDDESLSSRTLASSIPNLLWQKIIKIFFF